MGALQASGLKFAYDIWNEPDISVFWPNASVNSTQYFQIWDSAYQEIRKDAPGATIVGPDLAFTPLRNAGEWQTWLAHVKSAGTVPDACLEDSIDSQLVSAHTHRSYSSQGLYASATKGCDR